MMPCVIKEMSKKKETKELKMVHPNLPLKMQEVLMDNMKEVMFSMKEANLHKIIKDKMTIT